ncbi:MAG: hypothetical protein JST84_07845 [Acidobacteria bacterium]|nr:hypothetical protein [Acidobacteriota bacterium]
MALSRGAATSSLRTIDLAEPLTWEFSGFSQNGEDGVIDVLMRHIIQPNYYFIEIGASDGIENNTSWLAISRRFGGVFVEGNPIASQWCRYVFTPLNYGVEFVNMFVTQDNMTELRNLARYSNPDVFSLDIDGNDYYVAKAVLDAGFRPKIFIVEYNSAFGPTQSLTIPYKKDFQVVQSYKDNLYYGCSIAGWQKLLSPRGYKFVTVERNGVNAFFIDPTTFESSFVEAIRGKSFSENVSQAREYKTDWHQQFALIQDREFFNID